MDTLLHRFEGKINGVTSGFLKSQKFSLENYFVTLLSISLIYRNPWDIIKCERREIQCKHVEHITAEDNLFL